MVPNTHKDKQVISSKLPKLSILMLVRPELELCPENTSARIIQGDAYRKVRIM